MGRDISAPATLTRWPPARGGRAMECNHARLLLTFARDHADLAQSEADTLHEHLSQCSDCAALAASEQHLDEALGRAMLAVPVPVGLKGRLMAGLPKRPIRWRRWIMSSAAAAAI